jgi:hypothetical protein
MRHASGVRSPERIARRRHCNILAVIGGLQVGLVIPDLWQQEAIRALQQGKDVVVQAPTGSAKTYIFELFYPDLKDQAVFTVPTRALLTISWQNGAPGRARAHCG